MPIRKIDGRWYVDEYVNVPGLGRKRIRRKSPYRTKTETRKKQDQIVAAALSTLMSSEERRFDEDFVREFVTEHCLENGNRVSDVETKESVFRVHLLPEFGGVLLSEIGTAQIGKYKAKKLKQRLARKTVNNHLSILRTSLVFARDRGYLVEVPRFKWLKLEKCKVKYLKVPESERLVAAAKPGLWRAAIIVALRTGLRLGEIRSLRWCPDVDLEEGWIHVHQAVSRGEIGPTKDYEQRSVPLCQDALLALQSLKPGPGEYVFCNPDGSMVTRNQATEALRSACRRAGLKPCGWHHLRRSFASHVLNASIWGGGQSGPEGGGQVGGHAEVKGASESAAEFERRSEIRVSDQHGGSGNVPAISAVLGHQTWDMTKKYAGVSEELMKAAVRRLDSLGHYLGIDEPCRTANVQK